MNTIVLKDQANADVTFHHVGTTQNSLSFASRGDSLLDVKKLTLTLTENANTNRVKVKLSVPTVSADAAGKTVIAYTQVASSDITVVKFSTLEDRALIDSLFASIVSNAAVSNLVKTGSFPV